MSVLLLLPESSHHQFVDYSATFWMCMKKKNFIYIDCLSLNFEVLYLYTQSEIPLPFDGFLFDLLVPWDVRALSIRKTANLPLQLWVATFPRFVAIRFYFLSENLILIASPIIFLFIHNHLTLRKWCYTQLQHDFPLDPIISPFDFHFRTYVT